MEVQTINLKLLVLAVGLAFGAAGIAQTFPNDDYQAGKNRIEAESKAAKAKAEANEESSSAYDKANARAATAREEAATATNNAQYDVAVEKCDVYAAGAKDACLERAKARFGKS